MAQQYTKEQFWKVYETLPRELRDALGADATTNAIEEAVRNDASKYREQIVHLVGAVLIGLLLPQDFQKEVQKLGVKKDAAEKVSREINRFIFYPVRPALEQLHRMEIEVSARVVTPEPSIGEAEQPRTEDKPRGEDTYREPIE